MKFPMIDKILALGLAVATACTVSCSSGPGSTESSGENAPVDSIDMELRCGRTTQINKLNYTLTGPGGFSRTGTIDVSGQREVEGAISQVPVGSPYTLSLNGRSTDGNVTCTGSKSGISVTCPGNRERDEKFIKLTCTRNHLGREWGDNDWRDNARTFFLGAEFKLICKAPDAGTDTGAPDSGTPDTGPADTGTPDTCAPTTCAAAGRVCGPLANGCGTTLQCGQCQPGSTCNAAGQCVCQPMTACPPGQNCGTAPNGCGGTIPCGTCTGTNTCGGGGNPNVCGCTPATTCPAGQTCGTAPNGCGGTIPCGTCTGTNTCGGGGTPNVCGCTPATTCPAGQQCGTAPNGCGGTITCPTCPSGQSCTGAGQCSTDCPTTCSAGAQCGTQTQPGCPAVTCGTCPANFTCTANQCVCVPRTPAQACVGGQNCGTAPDGCGGTVPCGTCTGTNTCGGSGTPNVCGCTPTTTCPAGQNCGTAPNGCGGTIASCGTCTGTSTCGGGGTPNVCGCTPRTTCPAGQNCGTAPNGCGGTLTCGSCSGTDSCGGGGTPNVCGCTPTGCPAGQQCGTAPNGCGGTAQCPTCPAGLSCNGANQCVCIPKTACTQGQVCGTEDNGCGGTIVCGTCPPNTVCSANNSVCNPVTPPGCDINSNTRACLTSRDKTPGGCGQCAEDNGCYEPVFQGGTCELVTGVAPASCGPILGTPGAPTETQVCMKTLKDIFSSQCAASLQELPCLCGNIESGGCLAGTIPAQGPVFPVYQCDIGPTVPVIFPNFTVPRFGAGMANAVIQCAAQAGCDCF